MVYGWAGTILRVDLSRGKVSKTPSSEYTRLFIGGRGINSKLMFDESKPGVSAFDPENPIILGAGALVGTGITAAVTLQITSRSPEQHPEGFGELSIGGHWSTELKFAGYDHVVIKGRAEKPTYIYIENDDVQFKDATGVWGKGTFDTERIIREDLGDRRVQILAIGPAGEKLVRLATIEHERRSGTALGGVFGAKNLKAVVVRGTKGIRVSDPEAILKINEERVETLKKLREEYGGGESSIGANCNKYCFDERDVGTVGYFEGFEWPELDKTNGVPYVEKHVVKRMGCYSCPIADVAVLNVPGVGISVMRCYPFFWPRLVRLTDMDVAFKANMLCSDYGLDNRNLITAISWLMSLYDQGIITAKDTDGIPMEWGSADAIIGTIHKVANREGFGDILADGVLNLARKFGPKARAHLLHRRGMMTGSEEYRCDVGGALAAAVDPTASADHTVREIGFGVFWERHLKKLGREKEIEEAYKRSKEIYGTKKAIIPWEYEGKAQMEVAEEKFSIIMDLLGLCYFAHACDPLLFQDYMVGNPIPEVTPMTLACFKAAFGLDVTEKFLLTTAERTWNVEKAYNMREGFTRKDDAAYERYFKEPIPDGPRRGMKLDKAKFEKMKDEYYKLRGWDIETGNPTRETFVKLGMKDVADSLDKLGRLPKKKKP